MKKEIIETKIINLDKLPAKTKQKSLRPMRSMVATRSFKPKTTVAALAPKMNEMAEQN